jgi:hypothetical protein
LQQKRHLPSTLPKQDERMASNGIKWHQMASNGIKWHQMASNGIKWL